MENPVKEFDVQPAIFAAKPLYYETRATSACVSTGIR
jgi:hypothetical protein